MDQQHASTMTEHRFTIDPPTVRIDTLEATLSPSPERPGWWDLIIFLSGNPAIQYTYTGGKIIGATPLEAVEWLLYYMDDSGRGVHYGNSRPDLSNMFERPVALFCYKHGPEIYALLTKAREMQAATTKQAT